MGFLERMELFMSNVMRSGEMFFRANDLYPNVISGGVFGYDTSTMATPEAEDQEVLGEAPETTDVTSSEPKRMNVLLAIVLVVVIALFFGLD